MGSHKKAEDTSCVDLEGGTAQEDDDSEWDEWQADEVLQAASRLRDAGEAPGRDPAEPQPPAGEAYQRSQTSGMPPQVADGANSEREPEEEDPFAGFSMAPKIDRTIRHEAASPWLAAIPAPVSTSLSLAAGADEDVDGVGAWDDDSIDLKSELRSAAEVARPFVPPRTRHSFGRSLSKGAEWVLSCLAS